MSSRRTRTTSSTMTTQIYPENLRLSALLFRTVGLGLAIGALVLAIQISSHGGTPVFAYVASIWCLILDPLDIICLLSWTRIPPGGLIFLDTLAVGFCVGGMLNNIVVKNNGDGNNGRSKPKLPERDSDQSKGSKDFFACLSYALRPRSRFTEQQLEATQGWTCTMVLGSETMEEEGVEANSHY
ncbi:uncharacterized protein PAC_11214 [Phialocephala subalpina]|uniref:Uncharacterized protein n=1 Tax=Phialocephala subalpina TaxID=576137 RepID=A0A1L7X8G2_9HELO|nr:uncharacterized protein PAC_11214 [Phialocephala subalpina]